jgi:RNA polymerase sigma factor (sigma-70 family)
MQAATDMDLLRQYADGNSEAAFAALVSRYVNLVHSAALRKTGNVHAAEEITQAVFIILAQKARTLGQDTILPGWLYQATRLTAFSFLKREIRRAHREQEAYMQLPPNESDAETWRQIVPLLEDAMGKLGEKERNAVVLRFFEGKSFQEVGAAVGASENAAKKRVAHALEKLRRYFSQRGVSSTAAMIAAAISTHSVQAAPVALAKSVTAVAMAKGAVFSGSTLTLIKGALKLMAWTKVKTATVVAVALITGASVTTVAVKHRVQPKPVAAAYPGDWIWEPNSQTLERVPPLLLLQPTKLPASWSPFEMFGTNRYLARGKTVKELLASIYSQKDSQAKLDFPASLPDDKLDCIVTLQTKWWDALESEIHRKFNLVTQAERHDGQTVFVIKKAD